MKKILMLAAVVGITFALTGCGSLRTPVGERNGKVYYNTFFGLSLDSAVQGDGFVVNIK